MAIARLILQALIFKVASPQLDLGGRRRGIRRGDCIELARALASNFEKVVVTQNVEVFASYYFLITAQ